MKKVLYVIIILLFSVPYAYLATYLELAGYGLWGDFMAVVMPYILSVQASKLDNKILVVVGNASSLAISLYCATYYVTEKWWSFCKPFSPTGVTKFITLFMICASYAGWVIEKEILLRNAKKNSKNNK